MEEEPWGKVKDFSDFTGVSQTTITILIKMRKFPKDIADFDYGLTGYGKRRYKIKLKSALEFMKTSSNFNKTIKNKVREINYESSAN